MKRYSLFAFLFLAAVVSSNASNISVSGNVAGSWSVDTVFVNADIQIPYGQSLTIRPGCIILFNGRYQFKVIGQITAIGNADSLIEFSSRDTSGFSQETSAGGWAGVYLQNGSLAPGYFQYCVFRYMKGSGITMDGIYTSNQFKYCRFYYNRAPYVLYGAGVGNDIRNCIMAKNEVRAVVNIFVTNDGSSLFENNTIVNNTGAAIYQYGGQNTVCILRNNILWNNRTSSGKEIDYTPWDSYGFDSSHLLLQNCIVENGSQFPFYNESCFQQYPMFTDTAAFDFSLQWKNFPVKDGTRSIAIDNGHYLSGRDPDSTRADIGAIPFFQPDGALFTSVSFSIDSVLGYQSNHTVHFTNLSYKPYAGTTWAWDFGDGATSNLIEPVHTYSQSGMFTVKLLARDPNGHRDSLVLKNAIMVFPGTRIDAGAINGVWDKSKSPYYIYGDVFVPQDKKLELREGVQVRFMGQYNLDVYGSLIAKGNQNDSIRFVSNDTTGMRLYPGMNISFPDADFQRNRGWGGIHVVSSNLRTDTCWLEYCRISDVRIGTPYSNKYRGTLKLHHVGTAVIRNSLFTNNFITPNNYILGGDTAAANYQGAGISGVGTSATIEYNLFKNQYQDGPSCIYLVNADSAKVANNQFLNVTDVAAAIEYSKVYNVLNNKFDSVRGLCLRLEGDDPNDGRKVLNEIEGNLFYNSYRGIQASTQPLVVSGVYKIRFSNNIFRNNRSQIDVCLEAYGDSIYIVNNLFYNNSVTYEISNVGGTCLNVLLKNSNTGVIANNAFINNYGFSNYQAIIYGDSALKIYNNIIRDKAGIELQATYFLTPGWVFYKFNKAYNNNVKGGYSSGLTNYDTDPLFIDTAAHDFRLRKTSSSINNGYSDTAGLFLPTKDLFGNPRLDPFLNKIDVGVFEYISQRPIQLKLSNDTIQENRPRLTAIGRLTTNDPDSGDVHSYSFVAIPGIPNNNSEFIIQNDSLYSNITFQLLQGNKAVSIRTTDQFGAYLDSTFVVRLKENIVTGLPGIFLSGDIRIYPNPVADFLIIDAASNIQGDWTLCSVNGQVVQSGQLKGRCNIGVASLPKGSFLLKIFTRKGNGSFLILKQ